MLGETFPRFASRLEEINARMVDLLVPFRSRHLYHPKMKGSASIKNVLPAFVPELNYDDLEINDGGTASMVYLSCVKGSLPEPERENAYRNLREYCGLDTLAEVKLIEILYKHAQSTP